ncbi:MAG: GNAT family N-acetyltransferase, partial [Halobacteria archaeon]|nr:GNAT family N-acetyltransferase [Halobacteria archaeon]
MQINRLPANEDMVRRYVEELWLPYHRDLEETVDRHALADDADLVAEEVEFRLNRLQEDSYRAWVAVDTEGDQSSRGDNDLTDTNGELAGFITTDIDKSPS